MRTLAVMIPVLILCLCSNVMAQGEVVAREVFRIIASYEDQTQEVYFIEYAASIDVAKWESGKMNLAYDGDTVDTRCCHWEITRSISRNVFLAHKHSSSLFHVETLTDVIDAGFGEKDARFTLRSEVADDCHQAGDLFKGERARAESELKDAFNEVKRLDFNRLKEQFRSEFGAQSIEAEPLS